MMKGIRINQPGEAEIFEIAIPVRRAGEALLRVLYGGICGSDLGTYRGTFAYASYPRIPGHEFSAQIVEIDPADAAKHNLHTGQIITCNPYFNCGSCYSCTRGFVNCCEQNETMGAQRDGAFTEYITMPVDRIYDGKGLSPLQLTLIEPFCISYHGVSHANVQPGEKVLVIGAGTIGVLAAAAAKAAGGEVYIADIAPQKLDHAVEIMGLAGRILNDAPAHFTEQVEKITNGNGFDVTIEAVGLPATFLSCVDAAAFGGRVVQVGVGKRNADFNFPLLQKKELKLYGSRNALKKDFLALIDLVKSGKIDITKIVTNTYELADGPQAFKDFSEHADTMLKVVIHFADPE